MSGFINQRGKQLGLDAPRTVAHPQGAKVDTPNASTNTSASKPPAALLFDVCRGFQLQSGPYLYGRFKHSRFPLSVYKEVTQLLQLRQYVQTQLKELSIVKINSVYSRVMDSAINMHFATYCFENLLISKTIFREPL